MSNWDKLSDIVLFQPKYTEYTIWVIYDKVWYADAKTLWMRPEIENQSKQYPIDPKLNIWCD
jgi:hypothetical protein